MSIGCEKEKKKESEKNIFHRRVSSGIVPFSFQFLLVRSVFRYNAIFVPRYLCNLKNKKKTPLANRERNGVI